MLILLLTSALAAEPAPAGGCAAATLHHCATWLGVELQKDELRAYTQAVAVAASLGEGGRIYAPSELSAFYAAAATTALELQEARTSPQTPPDPAGPTAAELDTKAREWAQMRCRMSPDSPWPVWIGRADQERLTALCSVEPRLYQTPSRLLWVDGLPVAAGISVEVAAGAHVVQYLDGIRVQTAVVPVSESTVGFGIPAAPKPLEPRHTGQTAARWSLRLGGVALIAAGSAGLLSWGSQVGGDHPPSGADQRRLTTLSLGGLTLGTASLLGASFLVVGPPRTADPTATPPLSTP